MVPKTMRAAVCKEAGKPLEIEEFPVPTPVKRQILVRVIAATLCQSDIGIINGELRAPFPVVPGHEAVSIVEEVGEEVARYGVGVGDLVGTPVYDGMCLTCTHCVEYGPEFCKTQKIIGITKPGFFAEYALIDAASTVIIEKAGTESKYQTHAPQLSPLFCAGITVWDALERAKPSVNETVAIIGVGGLGALAIQFLKEMGVRVIGLDVQDEQLDAIRGVADAVVNTKGLSPEQLVKQISAANNGKVVDIALVTSGVIPAYLSALPILKPGGKLVVVGLPHDPIPFPALAISGLKLSILGARIPGQAGTKRCLDFALRKGLFAKVNPRKFRLEDINEMIGLMKANQVQEGRMVIHFD